MLLYLKVKPNQRFDRVEASEDNWLIKLKAPAVDGLANERLVEFLSEVLDLPKSKIKLKKGQTSRIKCLDIEADAVIINQRLSLASRNLHNKM